MRVRTPEILLPPVWPTPRSLATTYGISVDVFSSPYLDVSVQAVPHIYLWIQYMLMRYCRTGFPHSEISGSKLICSSPKLIAAYHVLLRLLMPRHSPCALHSLTLRRCKLRIVRFRASSKAHSLRCISFRSTALLCRVTGAQTFGASHDVFKLDRKVQNIWFSMIDLNYADSFVLPTKL